MIKRIAYPTDFSSFSQHVRDYVIELAQSLNSAVYIVHAIEPLKYEEVDDDIKNFYKSIEADVDRKLEKEKNIFLKYKIEVYTSVIIGTPWRVIKTFSREKDIDLIVMGSHGLEAREGEISVGSTSHKVFFSTPCPILTVKEKGT